MKEDNIRGCTKHEGAGVGEEQQWQVFN